MIHKDFKEAINTYFSDIDCSDQKIADVLRKAKGGYVVKRKVSVTIVFVLCAILLAATVLAYMYRAGIADFFAKWEAEYSTVGLGAYDHSLLTEPIFVGTVDGMDVLINDATANGPEFNIAATIESKGANVVDFYYMDEIEEDIVSRPRGSMGDIYYVKAEAQCDSITPHGGDVIRNGEESLTFLSFLTIDSLAPEIEMVLNIEYVKNPSLPVDASQVNTVRMEFTIPGIQAIEAKRAKESVSMGDTGLRVEDLQLRRTEIVTYCTLEIINPEMRKIALQFVDDNGMPIEAFAFADLTGADSNMRYVLHYCHLTTAPLSDVIQIRLADSTEGFTIPLMDGNSFKPYVPDPSIVHLPPSIFEEEELLTQAVTFDKLKYTVGTDIPSGYYTFHVPENIEGKIAVNCTSPVLMREFAVTGPAAYTVFLPKGAIAELSPDVTLSKVEWDVDWGLLESNVDKSRLLVGRQIPAAVYLIGLRPGFEDGHFTVYETSYDAGESDLVNRKDLHGDDMCYIGVGAGQYLELWNCYLTNYPFEEWELQTIDPNAVG